jgi:ankyrin repeat protein
MTFLHRTIARTIIGVLAACLGLANAATEAQLTSFFRAVQLDNARTVKAMLGGAIDPNQLNPLGGEPPLVQAVREDAMQVFEVLLANPATRVDQKAVNGNTALMMAAFKHNKPAVLALLAKGATVNQPGWTALHYAAASGDVDIVRILLDHHAYIDAESPAGLGRFTPLMMAAREGREAAARLLVDEGADASLKNSEGMTAAQIAMRADKPQIAAAIAAQLAARSGTAQAR